MAADPPGNHITVAKTPCDKPILGNKPFPFYHLAPPHGGPNHFLVLYLQMEGKTHVTSPRIRLPETTLRNRARRPRPAARIYQTNPFRSPTRRKGNHLNPWLTTPFAPKTRFSVPASIRIGPSRWQTASRRGGIGTFTQIHGCGGLTFLVSPPGAFNMYTWTPTYASLIPKTEPSASTLLWGCYVFRTTSTLILSCPEIAVFPPSRRQASG